MSAPSPLPLTAPQPLSVAPRPGHRWLIAACAVAMHLCIGSVYAYSVMTRPVSQVLGVTPDQVKVSFSIAILFLGLSAAFLGQAAERVGPRVSGLVSAVCWSLGLITAGLAVRFHSLWLFYLAYGVLGGIGLGIGYITPVGTLVKWFPDRRGMATGLAIMGFGFAAMIAAPVMARLFVAGRADGLGTYTATSVSRTFILCGAVYFVVMATASRFLKPPPPGWSPSQFPASPATNDSAHNVKPDTKRQIPTAPLYLIQRPRDVLRLRTFYLLWLIFGLNITCGIALISVASPMVQSMLSLSVVEAGAIVGFIGIFNGLGRIAWATASDLLGRPTVFGLFFFIQCLATATLPSITHPLAFQALLFAIMTCYGGGFATLPAFLGDLFGTTKLAPILGYTLTAWSVAGIVGPSVLIPLCHTPTGGTDYSKLLYLCAALMGIALITWSLMTLDITAKRRALPAHPTPAT